MPPLPPLFEVFYLFLHPTVLNVHHCTIIFIYRSDIARVSCHNMPLRTAGKGAESPQTIRRRVGCNDPWWPNIFVETSFTRKRRTLLRLPIHQSLKEATAAFVKGLLGGSYFWLLAYLCLIFLFLLFSFLISDVVPGHFLLGRLCLLTPCLIPFLSDT